MFPNLRRLRVGALRELEVEVFRATRQLEALDLTLGEHGDACTFDLPETVHTLRLRGNLSVTRRKAPLRLRTLDVTAHHWPLPPGSHQVTHLRVDEYWAPTPAQLRRLTGLTRLAMPGPLTPALRRFVAGLTTLEVLELTGEFNRERGIERPRRGRAKRGPPHHLRVLTDLATLPHLHTLALEAFPGDLRGGPRMPSLRTLVLSSDDPWRPESAEDVEALLSAQPQLESLTLPFRGEHDEAELERALPVIGPVLAASTLRSVRLGDYGTLTRQPEGVWHFPAGAGDELRAQVAAVFPLA